MHFKVTLQYITRTDDLAEVQNMLWLIRELETEILSKKMKLLVSNGPSKSPMFIAANKVYDDELRVVRELLASAVVEKID